MSSSLQQETESHSQGPTPERVSLWQVDVHTKDIRARTTTSDLGIATQPPDTSRCSETG